jgi:photosystem II stability/assembly factor-like uncharacterized protein
MIRHLVSIRSRCFLLCLLLLLAWAFIPRIEGEQPDTKVEAAEATLPESWVKTLNWRNIGPANMSGRITAISVFEADPSTYWVATASGGLLKTTNNGVNFTHQFDKEATVSIGDVCVAPSNRDIVWVGTGENNPRNSVSYGDGVYKSTDGGKTWKNMGLSKTFQIGRIAIHPKNPNVVYVGALGRLYGPNEERGLFKTSDGGKTWQKILYHNDRTGVIDLAMDPSEPDTLLVAMWERKRDAFDSFLAPGLPEAYDGYDPVEKWGEAAGIYKTTDGGKTFKKMTNGLPTSKLGRIGLDYYRKDPKVVFAIVDCEKIGMGAAPKKVAQGGGYMGFQGEDAEPGVKVTVVVENGPSAKAGLQIGDVIQALDKKAIEGYDAFVDDIRNRAAGDKIVLKVKRDETTKDVEVTLGQRPGAGGGGGGGGGGFGPGGAKKGRPYHAYYGGQKENVQDQQGPDGFEYGGVYKSNDGGESWTRVNSLNPRPMYFSVIRVDPQDAKYVYVLGIKYYRSSDGGKTFKGDAGKNVHDDGHALWIDPRDGRHMIVAGDGGTYVSYDRANNWDHLNHLSLGQFYHVTVCNKKPYWVYGGLQDNGSWGGPSVGLKGGVGPINEDWLSIGGGDGFVCRVDAVDPDLVYWESQNGAINRRHLKTGEFAPIRPRTGSEDQGPQATSMVFEIDPKKRAEGSKDDLALTDLVVESLKRRLDPNDLKHIVIRSAGEGRVEIVVPTGSGAGKKANPPEDLSVEDVQRIKDLVSRTGQLEFLVLANNHDDKMAQERMKEQFADPASQAELAELQKDGLPPFGPRKSLVDKAPETFRIYLPHDNKCLVTYRWVELGPQERKALNLDNAAEFENNRNATWAEACLKRGQATQLHSISTKKTPLLQGALFYSRECLNRNLPEDERRAKKIEHFVLVRNPEIDPSDPKQKKQTPSITGDLLLGAQSGKGSDLRPAVHFTFGPEGARLFGDLTRKNVPSDKTGDVDLQVRRHLAIVLDGLVMSAPHIMSQLATNGQISGGFSDKEVKSLVDILKSGALPAKLKPQPVSETTISVQGKGKGKDAAKHRFNWSTPFILSSHNPKIFYSAGEVVFKSLDRGNDLKTISPEITLTKSGSATALAESPLNADVLWAGTDDGALWVTRNGGKDWSEVGAHLLTAHQRGKNADDKGQKAGPWLTGRRWVSTIEASRKVEGRAYVCIDGHRSDDDSPYLFVTEDFGKTWKNITSNLPAIGSTRCLREDVDNPDLLYCGTEFSVFASLNRGGSWTRINNNLPTVAVHEIAVHPTAGEIVVATHGRSLWILDVSALRQMKHEMFKETAQLFKPQTTVRWQMEVAHGKTNRRFVGENPPTGAQIYYSLGESAKKVTFKVLDIEGKAISQWTAPAKVGLHRVAWDMTRTAEGGGPKGDFEKGGKKGGGGGQGRRFAAPGEYRIVMNVDGQEYFQTLRLEADPNAPPGRRPGEEEEVPENRLIN